MVGSLLIGAGVLGAATGAYYIGTKNLIGLAMDRKNPKSMEKGIDVSKLDSHMAEIFEKMKTAENKLLCADTERVET